MLFSYVLYTRGVLINQSLVPIQEKIEGKCIILCTAEESFNEMPSPEQLEAADYFFSRAYDPAGEEVVGLDTVEEAIGGTNCFLKISQAVFLISGFRVYG